MEELDKNKWAKVWDKNYTNKYAGEYSPLGNNKITERYFKEFLMPSRKLEKDDDEVLEIGCGIGIIADYIIPKVKSFVGTDISKVAIEQCKERFKMPNVNFETTTDILSLNKNFDCIYSITVFQHIPKSFTKRYIEDSFKILNKDGALFFNVLGGNHNYNEAVYNDQNKICEPTIEFTSEEITSFCKEAGFEKVILTKMEVDDESKRSEFWWYWVVAIK